MHLQDATVSPLFSRSKKKPAAEVLLIGADLQPLMVDCAIPSHPASFRGAVGDRVDCIVDSRRIILVGCGRPADFEREERFWESAGAAVMDSMRTLRVESAALIAPPAPQAIGTQLAMNHFAIGATLASYRCTAFRSKQPASHFSIKALEIPASFWKGTAHARQLAEAVNWSRALVEAPANVMTPQAFVSAAKELVSVGLDIKVLDQKALEKIGAGGLLAIGRSSEHPPCMLICQWKGRVAKSFDLGLVGKGLTFDAGGLNLKVPPAISKMKFDMAGGAAVVGAMRAMAQRRAPVNVVAAIPLCENVVDGTSYRPGDVIRSLAGLTIEVDNTDAEGRIVLADAMAYLLKTYKPQRLIDVATLTGAMMATLHEEFAGLFSTDDRLARELESAGSESGEFLWRLPLDKRQDYLVESEIADVRNVGAPGFLGVGSGSAVSGAKFLQRFSGDTPWAHLDIAGVAWATRPLSGVQKGPTGFGVRLIDAFVNRLSKTPQ